MFQKKRNIIIFGFLIILLVCVYGAFSLLSSPVPKSDNVKPVEVYFVNSAGNKLEPEVRYIEKGENVDEVTNIAVELIAGPVNSNLKRTMPSYRGGSNEYNFLQLIKTATRADDDNRCTVEIFFSEDYLLLTPAEEILLRTSLVWTFTSLDYVEGVKIFVAEEEITRPNGAIVGAMNRESVLLNPVISTEGVYQTITLYFPDANMEYLVKEERAIEVTGRTLEWIIVDELIKGPKTEGLVSVIPADTQINDVVMDERTCYVDLNSSFITKMSPDANAANMAIYSIVNSLTETNVRWVQFYIDAQNDESGILKVDLGQLFERDEDFLAY